ncbi:MAG: TlpA family protein disulfide reductase [Ilumatobacteraceae bacterium]
MCNREAPSVEEATKRWAGQAEFVGVAWSGSDDDYREFIDRHGVTFPQIDDTAADVFRRFGVAAQPAFAVITAEGEVQTLLGAADDELLDQIVQAAIDG